ncbi:MAG TPA: PEP/pyruvate-binding domain-containing protein, partial [Gaiellaceae bacterium]|nr:PEP/pyruvate-binding domain-containing protein [Gaiellaceae bacterium]
MHVVPFRALDLDDVALVGGKSAHLGDLIQAGFPVPPGFAVTAAAFDAVVQQHVDELLAGIDTEEVAALEQKAEHVRAVVESLDVPQEIAAAVAEGYRRLGDELNLAAPPVAVRSSAIAEDAADASFAGMQSTYLWLRGADEVLAGVRRCWASYFNAEALAYRAQHGGAAGMSVAVQCMVDARVAGVMFTLNPVTGDPSSIAIEAGYGLGVTVVGGEVTPDSYLFSKVTRELVRSAIGAKEVECVAAAEGGGTVVREVEAERR